MAQIQLFTKTMQPTCIQEISSVRSRFTSEEFQNRRRVREMIEAGVASAFGVTEPDLRKATRGRQKVAFARQVAMYLAHVCCGLTLTEVGAVFSRDRTTVAYACSVVEDHRDDEIFDYVLELLERVALSNIRPRKFDHLNQLKDRLS
ncbi:MAG: helix-turn-helix domain-containing protein [Hyphomicrobiaceae bacterium]